MDRSNAAAQGFGFRYCQPRLARVGSLDVQDPEPCGTELSGKLAACVEVVGTICGAFPDSQVVSHERQRRGQEPQGPHCRGPGTVLLVPLSKGLEVDRERAASSHRDGEDQTSPGAKNAEDLVQAAPSSGGGQGVQRVDQGNSIETAIRKGKGCFQVRANQGDPGMFQPGPAQACGICVQGDDPKVAMEKTPEQVSRPPRLHPEPLPRVRLRRHLPRRRGAGDKAQSSPRRRNSRSTLSRNRRYPWQLPLESMDASHRAFAGQVEDEHLSGDTECQRVGEGF